MATGRGIHTRWQRELKEEHRTILVLHLAGKDKKAIADLVRKADGNPYKVSGINEIFTKTFPGFFPQLQGLRGDAFDAALRLAGTRYLEDLEQTERLERQAEEEGVVAKLGRGAQLGLKGLTSYGTGVPVLMGRTALSERKRGYLRGRSKALKANYYGALPYFERARTEGAKRPLHLGGVILSDLANCHMVVGNMDQCRQVAAEGEELYREAYDDRASLDDSILLGAARMCLHMHESWLYEVEIDKSDECGKRAQEYLRLMSKRYDHYGWSKVYRLKSWSEFAAGLAAPKSDQGKVHLANAATWMEESLKESAKIAPFEFDFWWAFRDGLPFIGGHWRTIMACNGLADIYVHIDSGWDEGLAYYHFAKKELDRLTAKRFLPPVPPFIPLYEWKFWLSDGVDKATIAGRLEQKIQETRALGNNVYLPLMCISCGDFFHGHFPGGEAIAREYYSQALKDSCAFNCLVFAPIADARKKGES